MCHLADTPVLCRRAHLRCQIAEDTEAIETRKTMCSVRFLLEVILEATATLALATVFGAAFMMFGSMLFGSGVVVGFELGAFGFLWALTATMWKLLSDW